MATADIIPHGNPPLPIRLISSGNESALREAAAQAGIVAVGRVEVQWAGQWGGVCSYVLSSLVNWWSNATAPVVCRALGYPDGAAIDTSGGGAFRPLLPSQQAAARQPQWLQYLQCRGDEPHLGACRGRPINDSVVGILCYPEHAIAVACYGPKCKWGDGRRNAGLSLHTKQQGGFAIQRFAP